jgi:thiol-disulfide isomerase/thioredoxin
LSAAPDTPPRRDDRRRAPLMTHAWGALCLAAGLALAHAPAQALQPGEALGLQGRTLAGVPFNLAALRGKVVLVLFWSTHCAVCRDKMPELRANAHGWRGKPFELVSISVDRRLQDATDYDKLVAAMVPPDQRFPVLWSGDSTYQISAERPGGLPAAWLLDKSGRLVEQYTGRIPAEAWDKIADLL